MPAQSAWSIVAQEYRGVWPQDGAGRMLRSYHTRLEAILASEFASTHPANYTVEQFRAAFDILEKRLVEERHKVEVEAEAARQKAIEDALEAARWSRRIKRAGKRVANVLHRVVAVVKSQKW